MKFTATEYYYPYDWCFVCDSQIYSTACWDVECCPSASTSVSGCDAGGLPGR